MKISTIRDLSALIRHQRRKLGWDQQTLAERAGVSRYWVIDVENGKSGASVALVLRTLRALGLSLDVTESQSTPKDADKPGKARSNRPSADDLIRAALERPK